MVTVKVLLKGLHQLDESGLRIACTASLISSDVKIVVDPGHFSQEQALLDALDKEGLSPDDIDIVFLTHIHLDHAANTHLFKRAKVYLKHQKDYPGQYHLPQEGIIKRTEIINGNYLAKDVEFLLAPGHTEDLTALKVSTNNGVVVIAGDAISDEKMANLSKDPLFYNNLKDYTNSRKKILKVADYIVPGHGDIFKNNK